MTKYHTFRFRVTTDTGPRVLYMNNQWFSDAQDGAIAIAAHLGYGEPRYLDTDRNREPGMFPYGDRPLEVLERWGRI